MAAGDRHYIPVAMLEFVEGGNTLWVHNSQGGTVLRIACTKVAVKNGCSNTCAHADMRVQGTVEICIPLDEEQFHHRR